MEITNKYQNGKIYKLTDIGYNKCYIGSTCEELSMRMARHRAKYKCFLKGSSNNHIRSYDLFNEYGVENCKIELVEYFKCDTLQELRKREGEHIKNTECINKNVAGRTIKEYREQNKDKFKEYYENNIDKINKQKKQYYEHNRDKINEKSNEYYENNKNKIITQHKEYREQNKDMIKEKKK